MVVLFLVMILFLAMVLIEKSSKTEGLEETKIVYIFFLCSFATLAFCAMFILILLKGN